MEFYQDQIGRITTVSGFSGVASPPVKQDTTQIRDTIKLGILHRMFGQDCPAIDLDFVLVEFDHERPVALIEYKHCSGKPIQTDQNIGVSVLRNLGDMAKLPAFICRYDLVNGRFKLAAINDLGLRFMPEIKELSTEEYVNFLYVLRGRPGPFKPTPEAK